MNNFVDFNDITPEQTFELLDLAGKLKLGAQKGETSHLLKGKILGMIFAKSSTRTRVSFEAGMYQLGGHSLFLSSRDIQLGRGETIHDTAKVLSGYLDCIMIRTFAHSDVLELAEHASIPIINGLTDLMHPCQALADIMTVKEHLGSLKGKKLAYLGDGNNVANSLLHACSKTGMHICVASPKEYECDSTCIEQSKLQAKSTGGSVTLTDNPEVAVKDADAVYTDTWVSMGQESEKSKKVEIFKEYQVTEELMGKASKDAIFLHCLPAYRGFEVTEEVIDGPQSAVFDQSENRMHAQKAILVKLLGES